MRISLWSAPMTSNGARASPSCASFRNPSVRELMMHQMAANAATHSVLEGIAVSMYVRIAIDDLSMSWKVLDDMQDNQHVVFSPDGRWEI